MKSGERSGFLSCCPLLPRLMAEEKHKCMTVIICSDKQPVAAARLWCRSTSLGLCSADECLSSHGPRSHVPFQSRTTDTMAAIYFSDRAIYGPSLLITAVERKIALLPRSLPRNVILLLPKVLMAASCRCIMPTLKLGLGPALQ